MTAWPGPTGPAPSLKGSEGELVSVHVSIEPRLLERLLDVLAQLDFPINPEIHHAGPRAEVEFPAWSGRVNAVREAIVAAGFCDCVVALRSMLDEIRGGCAGSLPAIA